MPSVSDGVGGSVDVEVSEVSVVSVVEGSSVVVVSVDKVSMVVDEGSLVVDEGLLVIGVTEDVG